MEIMNLNQLKKAMKALPAFEVIKHWRPEYVGQVRRVTLANTQGFYSVIEGQPEHTLSRGNGGKGSYLEWDNAASWGFDSGVCSIYAHGAEHTQDHLIIALRVLDAAA